LEPVPDWLMSEVLEPVLLDIQCPRPVEIELGVEPRPGGAIVWFSERDGSGACGIELPDRSDPRAEMLVSWADWFQE
jgi:hypothetical protein